MSWGSVSVTAVPVADVEAKLVDARTAYLNQLQASDYKLDEAATEQIDASIAAVKGLVASGAVGSGLVTVTLSGHANPEHKPVKGWSNDSVTIVVYCADPQPTA